MRRKNREGRRTRKGRGGEKKKRRREQKRGSGTFVPWCLTPPLGLCLSQPSFSLLMSSIQFYIKSTVQDLRYFDQHLPYHLNHSSELHSLSLLIHSPLPSPRLSPPHCRDPPSLASYALLQLHNRSDIPAYLDITLWRLVSRRLNYLFKSA